MPILPDKWIREMAQKHGMIEPFVEKQTREGVISYGLSSYGYDARVSREFKIFTNVDSAIVDPKAFSPASFVDRQLDVCVVPPNSFALATTIEYFRVPRDVLVKDLCRRGGLPVSLLSRRGALRDLLCRPRRQIYASARRDIAEALTIFATFAC